MTFEEICSMIGLVATTITALGVIIGAIILKPAAAIKKKRKEEMTGIVKEVLTDVLPEILKSHDIEIRDKYKSDRENYLKEIRDSVLSETKKELDQITVLYNQYEPLAISAKDVIREKIVKIYRDNKDDRQLSVIEKERLDQYYKDYKELKGNSYIDKYYTRMCAWEIIEDDYDDDII